jgi:hypothetical protein
MKLLNVGLKRSISSFPCSPSMLLVFFTSKQKLSSQFFDLDIENSFGGGTLGKF